jgi:hypothetical protein
MSDGEVHTDIVLLLWVVDLNFQVSQVYLPLNDLQTQGHTLVVFSKLLVQQESSLSLVILLADLETVLYGIVTVLDHFLDNGEDLGLVKLAAKFKVEFQEFDVLLGFLGVRWHQSVVLNSLLDDLILLFQKSLQVQHLFIRVPTQ